MKESDLKELRKLHIEAESLAGDLISYIPSRFVGDSVTGCTPNRWDKHTIRIEGIDLKKYRKMERQIAEKTKALMKRISEVEDWIDSVDDPEMRGILRMYYVQHKSQEEIANKIPCSRSAIAQKVSRFWKENEEGQL